MSVRKAATSYNVRRTTLQRYLAVSEEERPVNSYQNCQTANMVFSQQMEAVLAQHIRDLDDRYHGIGPSKARELAWEFAKKNNVGHIPPSWESNQAAGRETARSFTNHESVITYKPKPTAVCNIIYSLYQYNVSVRPNNISKQI